MAQTTLSVRLDSADKKQFENFCAETGMNVSVAINIFIKTVLRENRLPFMIAGDTPNAATLSALEEGNKMISDPAAPRFHNVDELFAELNEE